MVKIVKIDDNTYSVGSFTLVNYIRPFNGQYLPPKPDLYLKGKNIRYKHFEFKKDLLLIVKVKLVYIYDIVSGELLQMPAKEKAAFVRGAGFNEYFNEYL
jgi:hypothetical protein